VTVTEGLVEVQCASEAPGVFGPGEADECLPTTPAARMGRARALDRRGDPPGVVLAALEAALVGASGPIVDEIHLLQASTLHRAHRDAEALAVAEAALAAGGGARRPELLRLAATAAMAQGGCERALPFTEMLREAGERSPCDGREP
jgi:hypothetical protein